MFYFGGKHVLSRYIVSRQLHLIYAFAVSVPAEDFITAHPNNMKATSRLQGSILWSYFTFLPGRGVYIDPYITIQVNDIHTIARRMDSEIKIARN
jgi:uncharacterized membrane protein